MHIIPGNDDGGAKTHLLNLLKNSKGLFGSVLLCINAGSLSKDAENAGLEVITLEQKHRMGLKIVKKISDIIADKKVDIVNFHGARANFLYLFLKSRISVPCVTTVHSDYRYDFINNFRKYMIFTPLNMFALKNFRNYICVSQRIGNLLDEKGFKGRKYIVRNGVYGSFAVVNTRQEIRDKYSIAQDDFVFAMVARMHPIKNHLRFLEASRKLLNEYGDIKILLVGSGDFEENIRIKAAELKIEDRVIFAGWQDNSTDYINAGDINILTSLNETFPLVILEGGMVKKAAICSDVGDMREVINETTGYIVNPESVEDIYNKMKDSYLYRQEIADKGEALYNIVTKDYSIEKFCRRYYDSYKHILDGDNNG